MRSPRAAGRGPRGGGSTGSRPAPARAAAALVPAVASGSLDMVQMLLAMVVDSGEGVTKCIDDAVVEATARGAAGILRELLLSGRGSVKQAADALRSLELPPPAEL